MAIRAFQEGDLASVVNCFGVSARVIAARHYRGEQIAVWAPSGRIWTLGAGAYPASAF
jgi:hypothetical protein